MNGADSSFVRGIDVEKYYQLGKTQVRALSSISVSIGRGEMVAFAGTSGSGKTTLLNLIGCLDSPSQGTILIGGKDVSQMTDDALSNFRAHNLGFIFQTFNLLPVLSALENVEYPLFKLGLSRRDRLERAHGALKDVGLAKFALHRPDQLSGGQRQRVAIARAMVHSPSIIIADEPTANLDKATTAEILELLKQLNQKSKITVIIATHDQMVMAAAGRVIPISDGHLSETGPA